MNPWHILPPEPDFPVDPFIGRFPRLALMGIILGILVTIGVSFIL